MCPPKWRRRVQQIEAIIIFVLFITFFRCFYLLFSFIDAMSSLPTSNIFLSSFAQYGQDVPANEQSFYMSVFVARCCFPCLPRMYVCPCCTLLLSMSNATRTTFYLLEKNSTSYTHVFLRQNVERKREA